VKRGFVYRVLPFFLAGFLLAAGALVPRLLLVIQQREFNRDRISVAAEDIHPYGDRYENMKNSLLGAVRLKDRIGWAYDDMIYAAGQADWKASFEQRLSRAEAFYTLWAEAAPNLLQMGRHWEKQAASLLMNPDGGEEALLLIEEADLDYGTLNLLYFDAGTGALVKGDLDLAAVGDGAGVQELWEGILEAYETQCGLYFGAAQVDEGAEDYDALVTWESTYIAMHAMSVDLTFRLEMDLYIDHGEWFFSIELLENDEAMVTQGQSGGEKLPLVSAGRADQTENG